ncbi:MAG: ribosome biogenesis GTP-binding protein YihA/YsxC [Chloroflexota bacterium]
MPPIPMTFVTSAGAVGELPESAAEVAIVGRSNVGKSSVINAIANQRGLARVSSTPGLTQRLNLFRVDAHRTIMDLPGYGFAKVPGRVKSTWDKMIEGYLLGRPGLRMVVVLVDGEVGPTKLDAQMLDWLRHHEVPHHVVATKQDKVKPSTLGARRRDLAAGCGLLPEDVTWVSAAKGTNMEKLRDLVRLWLSD